MPTRCPQFADKGDEIRSFDNAPFSRIDRQIVVNDPAFEQLIDDLLPTSRKGGVNRRVLSVLVANLIRCWWDDPDAFIALPMSNRAKDYRTKIDGRRNRYNPGEVSTLIIAHVDSLADAGLIDRRRGGVHPDTQQRALTRIRPDLDLLAMF